MSTAAPSESGASPFGNRILGGGDQTVRALRIRVQLLLTGTLLSTNLIGAVVVAAISAFVVPSPSPTGATVLSLLIAVPVYVVLALVIGAVAGTRTTLRALRWATRGDDPSESDRSATLAVPLRLTRLQAMLWVSATALFTVLALVLQPSRAVSTGLTVGIAGLVVCSVAYLFTQFALRPIAARALAGAALTDRPRGVGVGVRMVIFWGLGTAAPVVGLVVAAILALTGDDTTLTRLAVLVIVLGVVVLCFGLLVTVLNARSVVAPILSVRDALIGVQDGDLDRSVPVYDGTELGLLQSGFNEMVGGLREREHIRDMFGRHVGREVAAAAATGDVELGGETRVATVLFVDLVGSTTYAAEHSPAEVVEVLNRFFGVVVDEVEQRSGLVNKFMGDAVLAVFGAPIELEDHAGAGLGAARAIARRLTEEVSEVGAGVGVCTGEVVAGNVGAQRRFEYTVIGDAVNAASRLTELAKEAPGHVLVSCDSLRATDDAEEAACWVERGSTRLRGRHDETALAVLRQT